MENEQGSTGRKKTLIICGLLLLSATNAFWMLSVGTLDSHECFVSVTAREMLQSGDWIMPTCNGQLRLNKTPLSYWLVGITAKITGKVDEFSARLPSAVFAFLSAAVVLYFVNRWLGFRVAVISTSVWATSLAYVRSSHNARPDMALVFFVMLCLLSFYTAASAENRRRQIIYAIVFWISFALANLAKGPAPVPYVLIPVVVYAAVFRQWKLLPKLLPVVGLIIFLTITLPWLLTVAERVNWNLVIWKYEFIDRFFGDYAPGNYPVFYYLLIMFKYITPWVAFLPMALAAPFYAVWGRKQPAMKFLWLWFVVDLVFLTVDRGKRQHYILPLMPAMAVLIGVLLEDMVFTQKAFPHKFVVKFLQSHIVVLIAVAVAVVSYMGITNSPLFVDTIILAAVTALIIAVVAVLFAERKSAVACGAIFAGIVAWFMVFYAEFADLRDENSYSRDFAAKVAQIVPRSEKLVAYQHVSSRFVHYFGRVVPEVQDKSALYENYEQGNWVIATSAYLGGLACDERFRKVYCKKKTEYQKKEDGSGVLFHKSAPIVTNSSNNTSYGRPNLTEGE